MDYDVTDGMVPLQVSMSSKIKNYEIFFKCQSLLAMLNKP
jgi:hypothetical protein